MAGEVYGAKQFQVPWSAPEHVEYVDILSYDSNGYPTYITKVVPKCPEPPKKLTHTEEYTAKQNSVTFVEHESGATRVVLVPKEVK